MTAHAVAAGSSTKPPAAAAFDLDAAWTLHPSVSVRPEPFGALLYHFGNRRLSFLKTRQLLAVVDGLAAADTARQACERAGVAAADLPGITAALASLAAGDSICPRPADPAEATA
jgi:putative mycofactocin binding protein MftB